MANHSEVAHRWAQDNESDRTLRGYNMFSVWRNGYHGLFAEGSRENVIYSHGYHFPVAAFQTTPGGERLVLGNFHESRSNSTSQHQSHVRRAIPSRYRVFDVPYVAPADMRGGGGAERFHESNLEALLERANDESGKAKRARVHGAWHSESAARWLRDAKAYAEAFGLPCSAELETLAADLAARAQENAARYARERAEREERERQRVAQLRIDQAEAFAAWLNGAATYVPSAYRTDENGSAYVRRYRDELQTSMGAAVPWDHALKAFRLIQAIRARGETWRRNGHQIRVGHYSIDSVDAEGNMHAGCHYFAWSHMETLARQQGVVE